MAKIKVGPKGQITLTKELRDKFGISLGSLVDELETKEGILIKSVDKSLDRWAILKKKKMMLSLNDIFIIKNQYLSE